ncbi:unnamed protein product [Hymenolepis diminuta]|uniref:Uncharacterized protein n=1 Tax=Hymenolepis diminuta TaxID=6216 RepID=A0A564YXY7_HYMDI|nr:unnamed protein product [Hymenolepis diminuta]
MQNLEVSLPSRHQHLPPPTNNYPPSSSASLMTPTTPQAPSLHPTLYHTR